ncbi:MAG: UDP-N-acetylmuramoyl-tripeptide--D-alanyl-D-alanine ligase [Phycisphaerales bacterium]|nr:UDP-N-acetylmuramoyl-tripeptide--D-alanyl-D-alanine ligase [Phycisphaerales bacterium]
MARITAGRWVQPSGDAPLNSPVHVSTDTRTLQPGDVFIALRGERFDGNRFIDEAIRKGAAAVITDDASAVAHSPSDAGILLVADTVRALSDLAAAYRQTLAGTRIVAVTGSNGKTTTKRMIHAALSQRHRGSASPKSFNNHIGVPLTLLAVQPDDAYAVVEVGSSAPGEIAALGRIVRPDIAVITSIGQTHLEGLGSIDGVCREKLDLLRCLPEDGIAVITADAPILTAMIRSDRALTRTRTHTFGRSEHADLRLTSLSHDRSICSFAIDDTMTAHLRLTGVHNACNALAALLVAREFGVDDRSALDAIALLEPDDMRFAIEQHGSITLYNDAYNANPQSMAAALDVFAAITDAARRRVLILGDMLELGGATEQAHTQLGDHIAAMIRAGCAVELLVLVGDCVDTTARRLDAAFGGAVRIVRLTSLESDDDIRTAAALLEDGDQVLLKGSRGIALEQVAHEVAQMTAKTDMRRVG